MQLLLDPDLPHVGQLRKLYLQAFRDATQLYIASAYLTAWDKGHPPSSGCKEIVFIIGTDFGLSRKAANTSLRVCAGVTFTLK